MKQALQLRLEYQSCIKLARETDSKKEEKQLLIDAKSILNELKSTCDHKDTVVCLCSSYEGSYLDDYSDRHPECRKCMCCDSAEDSYSSFFVLISHPIARFEANYATDKLPIEVKEPLSYLLSEVVEVAKSKGYTYRGR